MSETFLNWQEFSQSAPNLSIGAIVSGGCTQRQSSEVIAAYDAPFPEESSKEGARQFPNLASTSNDDPADVVNVAEWAVRGAWTKPLLCCFSDGDLTTRGPLHLTIEGAGNFLQEEKGQDLAAVINGFNAEN